MQESPNPQELKEEEEEIPSSSHSFDDMDVVDADATESLAIGNSRSVPCFLRKVFDAEIENLMDGRDHSLLIIAVHAVFLESGFAAFDPAANTAVAGVRLPERWASSASTSAICVRYTIPSLVNSGSYPSVETVVLKFQILGRFVSIYGCLDSKGSDLHRISLDTAQFAPCIEYVYRAYEEDVNLETNLERIFFEFWKIVKDGLSTPLLISLCSKTGLRLPPCFMLLPTDLKLWILESLPAVDIAKVGCLCSELKYLSSNDDLWKMKFEEEFGPLDVVEGGVRAGRWKEKFVLHWKRKKMALMPREERPIVLPPYVCRRRGCPPFGVPGISPTFGRDYDPLLIPFGSRQVRRTFSPHCYFDGFRTPFRS